MTTIKIKFASNGYHVEGADGDWNGVYPDTTEGKLDLVNDFIDLLGFRGSRHDKERITAQVIEGDKYEDVGAK